MTDQPYPVRFLVFSGDVYYPMPAPGDFIGAADTMEGAEALLPVHGWPSGRWATVCKFDGKTMEEVASFDERFDAADKRRSERAPVWVRSK